MTEQLKKNNRHGLMGGVFSLIGGFLMMVVGAFILGCGIALVGMHTIWQQEGVARSERIYQENLAYLTKYNQGLVTSEGAYQLVVASNDWLTQKLENIHFFEWLKNAKTPAEKSTVQNKIVNQQIQKIDLNTVKQDFLKLEQITAPASPYVESAYHVLQDLMLRLVVLLCCTPAFILAILIGMVDGLAMRDVRKWSGGRETTLYRRVKRWFWPGLTLMTSIYLSWPYAFDASLITLPICGFLAVSVGLMASKYQKYI